MNPSKKRTLIAVSIVFAVAGLVFLLWGGYIAGWDIAGWFTTTQAYILYIMLGVYAFAVVALFVREWIDKR